MLVSLIQNKPFVGYISAGIGGLSGLLTILKVLTPVLGFAGALFGAAAGAITLWVKGVEFLDWYKKRRNKHK